MVAGCASKKSAPTAVAPAPTATPIVAATVVPPVPSPAPETQIILEAPPAGLQNRFLVDLNDLDCRADASSAMGRILHESGPVAADGTVMMVLWSKDRPVRFRVSREMCGWLSQNRMMAEVIATYSETATADPTRTYTVIAYSVMHPSIIVGTTPATTAAYEAWARQEDGLAWRRLSHHRSSVFDLENVQLRGRSASIWHAVEAVGAQ